MRFLEFMAAAYAVIWAAILVYFIALSRREKQIWTEVRELRERLSEGESDVPR